MTEEMNILEVTEQLEWLVGMEWYVPGREEYPTVEKVDSSGIFLIVFKDRTFRVTVGLVAEELHGPLTVAEGKVALKAIIDAAEEDTTPTPRGKGDDEDEGVF